MNHKLSEPQTTALRLARIYGDWSIARPRTVQALVTRGLVEPGHAVNVVVPTPAGLAALEQHEAQR